MMDLVHVKLKHEILAVGSGSGTLGLRGRATWSGYQRRGVLNAVLGAGICSTSCTRMPAVVSSTRSSHEG